MTVELALTLAIGGAALAIAIRSPFHAFCVFLAALPFEDALSLRGALKITPAHLALLTLVGVCLVHPRRRQIHGSVATPLTPFLLAYVGVAALSLVMTIFVPPPSITATTELLRVRASEYRGLLQFALLVFSAMAFFLTLFFCSDPRRLRFAVGLLGVVSGVVALYAIFQMVGVWGRVPLVGSYAAGLYEQPASLRPNATFQEPMLFGHFLLAGLPLVTTLFLQRRSLGAAECRFYGWPGAALIVVMVVALILTISRAAWIGAAASSLVILALSPKAARTRSLLLFGLVAILGLAAFVVAMGSPLNAWHTVVNRFSLSAPSLAAEQRLWYQGFLLELAAQYPLLGVGLGNYPLYQLARFDSYGIAGAYGVYWQALVETGLLGFASLILLLFAALRVPRVALTAIGETSPWRPYLAGCIASMTGLFVGHLFLGDRLGLHVWVLLGIAAGAAHVSATAAVPTPTPATVRQ